MPFNFKVEGMDKLLKDLEKIGDVPQRHVTAAVKKGVKPVLKDAIANAPEDTGALKKGIIMVGERSYKSRGKKVYRLVFDRSMNHIFQKESAGNTQFRMYHGYTRSEKDPRWEKKISYYPISQEYGFFAKNGRYIPGFFFGHGALKNNTRTVETTIVSEMQKKIDAEIVKAGLK
jgi:hypothetical protein